MVFLHHWEWNIVQKPLVNVLCQCMDCAGNLLLILYFQDNISKVAEIVLFPVVLNDLIRQYNNSSRPSVSSYHLFSV